MNKLAFWFLIFFGCMCAFFKYEVGSHFELESTFKILLNLGLWTVCFSIIYYGTPNGFIKGIRNMKKGKKNSDN